MIRDLLIDHRIVHAMLVAAAPVTVTKHECDVQNQEFVKVDVHSLSVGRTCSYKRNGKNERRRYVASFRDLGGCKGNCENLIKRREYCEQK